MDKERQGQENNRMPNTIQVGTVLSSKRNRAGHCVDADVPGIDENPPKSPFFWSATPQTAAWHTPATRRNGMHVKLRLMLKSLKIHPFLLLNEKSFSTFDNPPNVANQSTFLLQNARKMQSLAALTGVCVGGAIVFCNGRLRKRMGMVAEMVLVKLLRSSMFSNT